MTVEKPISQDWRAPVAGAIIVALVFAAVWGMGRAGWLQPLELAVHDCFVRWQPPPPGRDTRIVLIEQTEQDIRDQRGWPIPDGQLARLLEALLARGPAVIGLDIYRDMPVPGDGRQIHDLNTVLTNHDNVVCIWKFGDERSRVPPPPILENRPDRIGFGDFVSDVAVDGKVRRGLLCVDDGVNRYDSFALQLAAAYLRTNQVETVVDYPDAIRLGKTSFRPFEKNDGAYVNADAAGFQFLLDFRGPREFDRYPVSDALAGRLPAAALSGKIVLVGVSAESVKDEMATPINPRLRGIELNAMTVNQLLRAALEGAPPVGAWSDRAETFWTLAWCFLGGWIGFAVRAPWRFALWLLAGAVVLTGTAWGALLGGVWIPWAAPAAALLPAAGLLSSYMSYRERQQRLVFEDMFSKLLGRPMVRALWKERQRFLDGTRPRPQEITVTVLFTDLKGFTAIAEQLGPARLLDWLNDYMGAMAKAVTDHHGVVEKFLGDGLMALFGAPFPSTTRAQIEEDAVRAVECALAMSESLAGKIQKWGHDGLPAPKMRVGIYTGPGIAGGIGSVERMDFGVIGDTVNTASRLESFRKDEPDSEIVETHCRILVGEPTYQCLRDRFRVKLVGSMTVRNRKEPVTIYQVLRRNAPSPAPG